MKKIIALITSFVLVVALVGCSAAPAAKSSAVATKAAATTAAATTAAPAATSAPAATAAPATTAAATASSSSGTGVVKLAGQKWINSCIQGSVTADTATDPTDDFNVYVNKDWIVNLKPNATHIENKPSADHEDEVTAQIQKLLSSGKLTGHDATTAAAYYSALTDMKTRNASGVEPIRPEVEKILAIKSLDDLTAYLSDADDVLGSKLCKLTTEADTKDSTRYIISVGPEALALDDAANYAANSQAGKVYGAAAETLFTNLMQRFGMKESEAKERYAAMITLETKLASGEATKADMYTSEYISSSYNPMSVDKLQKTAGSYPVSAVLKTYTDAGFTNFSVTQPKWLAKLSELYTKDNVEAMKDILLYSTLFSSVTFLDQDCIDAFCDYGTTKFGSKTVLSAEQLAYKAVALDKNNNGSAPAYLCWAVGRIYAESCVTEATKKDMNTFVNKIVEVYRNRLENNTWLSDATKKKALEKLGTLKVRVAYPDDWSKYSMEGLNLKSSADGGNVIKDLEAVKKYALKLDVEKVCKPVDKNTWADYPQIIGANYEPADNSINIPAAALTGCFYSPDWSEAENMGALGCVVGHEITHAFDSMGSQYDKDGNLSNWWTQEDAAAFKKLTDKVSAYYSTMEPFDGQYVNGDLTIGESVADLGGMSCMLEMAKSMKDFDYKAFFSSWARVWGYQASEGVCRALLSFDPHPPVYLRANVTVQQFAEFYDTYGVKEGDNMYLAPADRLSVW